MDQQIEVPQIRITPIRQMLEAYRMTAGDLMKQVDIAFAGEKAGEIYQGQFSFDLMVRFQLDSRNSMDRIRQALIRLPLGSYLPMDQLASVS